MDDLLPSSELLSVGALQLLECSACSAMVVRERMPRHVRLMHPGWSYESLGPLTGRWTKAEVPDAIAG